MKTEIRVASDMLWAFFPAGTEMAYRCHTTDEELCGVAETTNYSAFTFTVGVKIWDHNCQAWESYSIRREISEFADACKFTTRETHPLQFKSDLAEAERKF